MKKNNLLIFIFLVIIYWSFVIPGPRVAGDFHYSYPETLASLFNFPFLWSTKWGGGLGHYVSSLWAWPYEILNGFLGILDINFSWVERFSGILLIVVLGIIGIKKLLTHYKVEVNGQVIGMAFFLTNSYFILLIDGGQLNLAVGYSILPLSFYFYKKFIETKISKYIYLFTLSITGISAVDLRVVVLLGFLIFIDFIFSCIFKTNLNEVLVLFKKTLKIGFISGTFLILLNSYWILPIISSKTTAFIPANYSHQVEFLSFSKIANAIFLQQPHWYQNDFGKVSQINPDFLLIPILILLTPVFLRKDSRVAFWLIVSSIFIFLSKGSNPPLPQINSWLSTNIPVFILFRDPTKFYFLISLSFSILIGISIDEILKRLPEKRHLSLIFLSLILGYFLYLNSPVITLKMNGLFSPPIFEKEFKTLNTKIQKDKSFGRIVWIPVKSPLGYESSDHPAVDAYTLMEKRPFAISNKGTYERLNFLREAAYSGQLLDVAGIQSIIYPPLDYRKDLSDDQKEYYSTFLNQLKNMPYIKSPDLESKIPKLDLIAYQDRFFIPQNFWWVIGSDEIYQESTKSAKLSLSNNALVFAEESIGLGEKIKNYPFAKIILNNKTPLDFAASLLKPEQLIFPAKALNRDPDSSGWWKRNSSDFLSFKDFLETKYGIINQDFDLGGGWSVAENNLELNINDSKINANKILLARVLESTRSGELLFYQDNELIGGVNTIKLGDNVRWFEIGSLKSEKELTIKSKGEINVVNALAILDKNEFDNLKNKSDEILTQQASSLDESLSKNPDIKIIHKKINPTKFEININGLDSPKLLVFSDSFSGLWELNGQKPIPVFSIINGFVVNKNGDYVIEFSPQKYVYPGLAISVLSFLILLALLLRTRHD